MFCSQCGKPILNTARFCKYCGCSVDNDAVDASEQVYETQSIEPVQAVVAKGNAITCTVNQTTIRFPKRYEQWHSLYILFLNERRENFTEFRTWYLENLQQHTRNDTFFEAILEKTNDILRKRIQLAVDRMARAGHYYLSVAGFCDKYRHRFDIEQHLLPLYDQYAQIIATEQEMAAYQAAKKAGRGYWQGGGFGLKGAVKGAVTASALNAGSGIIHGIFDGISRAGDRSKIRRMKEDLFSQKETHSTVLQGFWDCDWAIFECMIEELSNADIINAFEYDGSASNAILENAQRFATDSERYIPMVLESIELAPINHKLYQELLQHLGYPHYELCKWAEYWGFQHLVEDFAVQYFQNEFSSVLNLDEDSLPAIAHKRFETNRLTDTFQMNALAENLYYMATQFYEEFVQPCLEHLDILQDIMERTIDGYTFDSVEALRIHQREIPLFEMIRSYSSDDLEGKQRAILELIRANFQSPLLLLHLLRDIRELNELKTDKTMEMRAQKMEELRQQLNDVFDLTDQKTWIQIREMVQFKTQEIEGMDFSSFQKKLDQASQMLGEGGAVHEVLPILQQAIDAGSPRAQGLYGVALILDCQEKDVSDQLVMDSLALVYEGALSGDIKSQCVVSDIHAASDGEAACFWISLAAESGDTTAQTQLAVYFAEGKIVAENKVLAKYWMQKAVEVNDANAQYIWGYWLINGTLGMQDDAQGVMYMKKSAIQKFNAAITYLEEHKIPWIPCPACNNLVCKEDKFCGHCGYNL